MSPAEQNPSGPLLYFSDVFGIERAVVADYGAFDVSLVADLPLFIDPFLLFNSTDPKYQALHEGIITYMRFLYDKSLAGDVTPGLLEAWYRFKEVKQTWLGFARLGNEGLGLGRRFASSIHQSFPRVFDPKSEAITTSRHLEKLCLIAGGVGRDTISDFTTNLIKRYLLEYTQTFARQHIAADRRRSFRVPKSSFNYDTESWETRTYDLPAHGADFVLLVPCDILTRDDTWINSHDLIEQFDSIPIAISDAALRAEVNNYFRSILPKKPKAKDRSDAVQRTIRKYPELVDYYIKHKEETGDAAQSISQEKVERAAALFLENFGQLVQLLQQETEFYHSAGDSYAEALARANYLKQVIENNDGYKLFYDSKKQPIRREEDLQVAYKLVWYGSTLDVNREVNNGRGPVDFKVSKGASDKVLVEFKLASNSQLRANLAKQVEIYEQANESKHSIKVILFFTAAEKKRVDGILKELTLTGSERIVLVDARRDNKPSASRAR